MDNNNGCNLCPRNCKTDRSLNAGYCGQGENIKIARAMLHFWEEPCISGKGGSGAVFFSGCSLGCVYCQNYKISKRGFGEEVSVDRLSEIFLELQDAGAENINLVTPTHFAKKIVESLEKVKQKLNIPVVYNTSGYETLETLSLVKDYVDIYLTDIKYYSQDAAFKYSKDRNYPEIAFRAASEMISQKKLLFDNEGMIKKGVIIRHLVLPGMRKDSIKIIEEIKNRFGTDKFVLSLMSQYTPYENIENFPELDRKITTFEYNSVVDAAVLAGFKYGYMQDRCSAEKDYTPSFNLEGVKRKEECKNE